MNKTKFIDKLSATISYSKDKCLIINDILESNFFISKSNKDKIIKELTSTLDITSKEANNIYITATNIIKEELTNKLKHPFKNQD